MKSPINKPCRAIALAMAMLGTTCVGAIAIPGEAQADDRRWGDHDKRRWHSNHWDRRDWRRHHPYYYVAPGPVYTPPPVVYAPPPVHPGFSLHFGF